MLNHVGGGHATTKHLIASHAPTTYIRAQASLPLLPPIMRRSVQVSPPSASPAASSQPPGSIATDVTVACNKGRSNNVQRPPARERARHVVEHSALLLATRLMAGQPAHAA